MKIYCAVSFVPIPSNVLFAPILNPELRSRMLALPCSPELHFAVVTCDSKKGLDMNIPSEVRIIDIADILTLLDEVKKFLGITW
ncbi:MAG: hypothetical protein WBF33_27675 [Candidatus Nitrosopolaris sp.]|jgi:hypothetical protein